MKALTLALVVFTASAAYAQPQDLSGHWKGTVEIPSGPLDFEMDVARNARGEFAGALTDGADHATLPLLKIGVDGKTLTFYTRADQPFRGEILGKTIAGTVTLSGYALPFSMGRTGDPRLEPRPTSRAVSKELEGTWAGVLRGSQQNYHLVVTIANQADGTAMAQTVSVDEGGLTLPVVVAQDGTSVKIDTRGVATSFTGTLNATGTELTGTWSQGDTSLPLTFTRARVEGTR